MALPNTTKIETDVILIDGINSDALNTDSLMKTIVREQARLDKVKELPESNVTTDLTQKLLGNIKTLTTIMDAQYESEKT